MKVQGNRYINNPEMIKNKVEKKTTVPQNIISEDDVKISDSARKLVETARNKVSDFHTRSEERRVGKECRSRWSP